ncbi:malate synthase [Pseudoalteromonas sp. T1lg65]|uniref:malate synthase n=1 Tax=Pseudoalteromonas sp. T1lg65 TaxID=2077101 RepID=UPI003F78D1CC
MTAQIQPQIPLQHHCRQQQSTLAKQYLDQHCPLEFGSHQNVTDYVVYFHHLLAFFENGEHCGLQQSAQFVALCGHKENPEAILLQKPDGFHIELSFNRAGDQGQFDSAHIEDILVETPLSSVLGKTTNTQLQKLWMSFYHGVQQPKGQVCYRSKDGQDYQL